MTTDDIAQQIWQEYAAETGRALPPGLAEKLARAALTTTTVVPFQCPYCTGGLRVTATPQHLEVTTDPTLGTPNLEP
jgi:hypothetical protein